MTDRRMRDGSKGSSDHVTVMPWCSEADSRTVDQGPVVAVRGAATILQKIVVPAFVHTIAIVMNAAMLSLLSSPLHAGTFVTWDASDPTRSTASADGVNVSVTYDPAPPGNPFLTAGNLSGSDFDPPGASNQSFIDIEQNIGMTWTFDQPVEDLLLYLVFWRGSSGSAGGPPDGNYTFDQTPTIQSGLADGTISGNSLVVTSSQFFYSGILSFPGQLTSLSLLTPATGSGAGNGYTMSFTAAVPEPATTAILLSAGGVFALWRCRRRR